MKGDELYTTLSIHFLALVEVCDHHNLSLDLNKSFDEEGNERWEVMVAHSNFGEKHSSPLVALRAGLKIAQQVVEEDLGGDESEE